VDCVGGNNRRVQVREREGTQGSGARQTARCVEDEVKVNRGFGVVEATMLRVHVCCLGLSEHRVGVRTVTMTQ
jgi:hypothetical protein